jgi:Spy/CpxP family protein refolding chaperone
MKVLTIIFLTLTPAILLAQTAPDDPLGKAFFSPELVMQNQEAIGLTDAQRTGILKEMQSAQSEFMTLQWDMQKESEKLKALVEKDIPAEAEVIAQLDRLLSLESKVKHRQITLMVRIKSSLTADQQDKLRKLRK